MRMSLRMLVASGLLVLFLAVAGCGQHGPSEADVAGLLEKSVPKARDVHCTRGSGDQFSCDAVVNGKETTFNVTARGSSIDLTP
jgi:hypothetical protein